VVKKHSRGAIKAHPAPVCEDYQDGKSYAEACMAVNEARTAFDAPKKRASDKLDDVGITAISERILDGDTFGEIAESIGVSRHALADWLEKPEHKDISARAREDSAEAWLDKGLKQIKDGIYKDSGIDAGAARAYAQECARRASIRNARYREKVALGGDTDNPINVKTSLEVSFVAPTKG